MKRFLATLALTCALSIPVLAGEIPTCSTEPPPAPDAQEVTMPGEIPSTGYTSPGDAHTCGLIAVLTLIDLVF